MTYVYVFAVICVLILAGWRLYVWIMKADDRAEARRDKRREARTLRRDPFAQSGLIVDAATVADIDMTRPSEIACDEYPRSNELSGEAHWPAPEEMGAFLSAPPPQSSPAQSPATPPRRAQGPGTAAAAGFLPAPAPPPPLPALLSPAAAAIGALRVLTAPHRAAQARAWQAEVMSVFPPDRPWPGDDTLTRMTAIKGDL